MQTPLREFLRTETGGAAILLAATLAALVWANIDADAYERFWSAVLSIDLAGAGISLELHEWVNSGLMTFFFFVVGLEARREFDLGELRERRRFVLAIVAALGGMGAAVAIYLAFNAGEASAQGWGVAMSTDTAFALGFLALVGPRFPDRLRAFLLTIVVVDDLVALLVIATVYTENLKFTALLVAAALFGAVLAARALGVRRGAVYLLLGAGIWVALLESGIEPVIVGLAMGLLAYAYPVARSDLEVATERFREFREQPTADLARSVRREPPLGPLAERPPPAQVSSVDELPDRPDLRPRQRRHRRRPRPARTRLHLADHPRHSGRLRRRQAGRYRRRELALHACEPRSRPDSRRLGSPGRRRHDRRDRLHGGAARRRARLRGRRARGGEGRHPGGGRRRGGHHVAPLPRDRVAAPAPAASGRSWAPPRRSPTSRTRSTRSRTTFVARSTRP